MAETITEYTFYVVYNNMSCAHVMLITLAQSLKKGQLEHGNFVRE